jgi:transposase
MDLVPIEGDDKVVPHSADDSHQHYAQGNAKRSRSTSRRVEVIIGDDRRRRWSPEDKAKITASAKACCTAGAAAPARAYRMSRRSVSYRS